MSIPIHQRFHVAKKEHVCDASGEKIPVGERYHVRLSRVSGRFVHWREHVYCLLLQHRFLPFPESLETSNGIWDILRDVSFTDLARHLSSSPWKERVMRMWNQAKREEA